MRSRNSSRCDRCGCGGGGSGAAFGAAARMYGWRSKRSLHATLPLARGLCHEARVALAASAGCGRRPELGHGLVGVPSSEGLVLLPPPQLLAAPPVGCSCDGDARVEPLLDDDVVAPAGASGGTGGGATGVRRGAARGDAVGIEGLPRLPCMDGGLGAAPCMRDQCSRKAICTRSAASASRTA